jgi:hypothetical protein
MVLPKQILLSTVAAACALFSAVPALCAEKDAPQSSASPDATEDAENDLSIGLNRREEKKEVDHAKGIALCKKFAYDTESFVDGKAIQAEATALAKDSNAKWLLLACLDPKNNPEPDLRRGAMNAMNQAKLTSTEISNALAAVAITDPSEAVRKAAIASIKLRKDDVATKRFMDCLLATYDEAGNVKLQAEHDNAIEGGRALAADDNRIFQSLVEKAYYATLETRITNTEVVNVKTRQIDSYTVNSGAQVNLILRLSFPVQFPELKITRIRTTVKAPCINALEELSGQGFGEDVEKWDKWMRKHS